jgi:hypothetical protein
MLKNSNTLLCGIDAGFHSGLASLALPDAGVAGPGRGVFVLDTILG